jgi:DNA-binding MarR family transcriptional regulator
MSDQNVKKRQAETRRASQMMKRMLIHFRGQMDEQLRPQGVTASQLHLLKTIRESPGASGAQLARSCYVTPQSAQTLLKGLESGGWITRKKDRENDRILIVALTPSGEELLATADKLARAMEKKVWQGISMEEVETLNAILTRCMGNMEE